MAVREFSFRPNGAPQFIQNHTQYPDAGAVTTEAAVGAAIKIPARMLGRNGSLSGAIAYLHTNSANNKTVRVRAANTEAGALTGTIVASKVTTAATGSALTFMLGNRNGFTAQLVRDGAFAVSTLAIDTSKDVYLQVTAQKATGAETLTVASSYFELRGEPDSQSFQ